ncbi:RagB/SusD family nutrient uptake outer membrane protein [Niabella sp. 22666]|jgi:hypothetical protein|uniref:RagB/SusD family nutrient uptake outer membrane protein n=1 Tax=Niabella sp. 22666 TaxID=3453954 RepID=UPI003F87AD44
MKQIIIYTIVLLFLYSCKKNLLDITPDGRMGIKEVFEDQRLTEAFLNTTYASIPNYFWRYNTDASFLAGISDEAKDADIATVTPSSTSILNWNSGTQTPSVNVLPELSYASFWAGIRNANVFLENIDNANVADPAFKARMKGEAQLLRAFYYWELIKQHGPMPIIESSFTADFDYSSLKRPTFQECVDFIVKECDAVIVNQNVPLRLSIATEAGRFTRAIAYAVKSQSLLYNASPLWNPTGSTDKWEKAAEAADLGIKALETNGQFALVPFSYYVDYFINPADINSNPNDKETIFERPDVGATNFVSFNTLPSKNGVKAGNCPSQELVDSYDMQATGQPPILGYTDEDHLEPIVNAASGYDPQNPYQGRDPRFYTAIWHNGATYNNILGTTRPLEIYLGGREQIMRTNPIRKNTPTGYYMRKFIDSRLPVNQTQAARWKKYRLAELYLNYAEAQNEALQAPTTEVYSRVNAIRARAQMPALPAGLTKEQMRERIRRERRVEFAFEEHRFWDVRRWKILDQTDKLVTGMEITRATDGALTYKRFVAERRNAWQEKFRLFPIPVSDASIIPDFNINQNPGW